MRNLVVSTSTVSDAATRNARGCGASAKGSGILLPGLLLGLITPRGSIGLA